MIENTGYYGKTLFTVTSHAQELDAMFRAFIEKGIWHISQTRLSQVRDVQEFSAQCINADVQKMATLRVSALAAIATLAVMAGPEFRNTAVIASPAAVAASTVPEMVSAKSQDRVPNFDDMTSLAPTRRKVRPNDDGALQNAGLPELQPYAGIEVVNATTLRSADMTVRLAGIALPQAEKVCRRLDGLAVSCADRAISYLQLLVKGRAVACEKAGVATDGVEKGRCRIGETDVAEQMVRQGWAKVGDNPDGWLVVAEASARKQKLGIWRE